VCRSEIARCGGKRPHVIFMGLGSVFGIFALAVQRVLGDRGFEQASFAIDQGNANAQCSEIHSSHEGHQQAPFLQS
jgi:hypothetical protein